MERKGNIDFSEELEATKLRKNYLGSKCTEEDRMACGKMLYNVLLGATPNPCTEQYLERERENIAGGCYQRKFEEKFSIDKDVIYLFCPLTVA